MPNWVSSEEAVAAIEAMGAERASSRVVALQHLAAERSAATTETSVLTEGERQAVDALFEFTDYVRVHKLLARRNDLVEVLLDAHASVMDVFGVGVALKLDVVPDYEWSAEDLLLTIETGLSVEDSRALLEKFDQRWWRDAAVHADQLVIDLAYA